MKSRPVRFCCICGKRFEPDWRLGKRQRTCGGADCQKMRRRANTERWRAAHPEADDSVSRQARQRDRRAYRRHYWATHPDARRRHGAYMRQWRARRRVRDPYRDTPVNLPAVNVYLQVTAVREANRVITAKLVSVQDLMAATSP